MVMQEGQKPYPTNIEEMRWWKLDEQWTPPTAEQQVAELTDALRQCVIDNIAELADDIGFLVKLRQGTTDIDALGKIAILIDLNQAMMREYGNELAGQKS
jgi:hypothetical protein